MPLQTTKSHYIPGGSRFFALALLDFKPRWVALAGKNASVSPPYDARGSPPTSHVNTIRQARGRALLCGQSPGANASRACRKSQAGESRTHTYTAALHEDHFQTWPISLFSESKATPVLHADVTNETKRDLRRLPNGPSRAVAFSAVTGGLRAKGSFTAKRPAHPLPCSFRKCRAVQNTSPQPSGGGE